LTASARVLEPYCFTPNFGHVTGASLHSHYVPEADHCGAGRLIYHQIVKPQGRCPLSARCPHAIPPS